MAWLSPFVLANGRMRDDDHKTNRPPRPDPCYAWGLGGSASQRDQTRGRRQTMSVICSLLSCKAIITNSTPVRPQAMDRKKPLQECLTPPKAQGLHPPGGKWITGTSPPPGLGAHVHFASLPHRGLVSKSYLVTLRDITNQGDKRRSSNNDSPPWHNGHRNNKS